MKLAKSHEYELPHTDWISSGSGSVYRSKGKPDTDFDPDADHAVSWYPNNDCIEEYIEVLEGLEVDDKIVMCGYGPAPLKGRVVETGDYYIRCGGHDMSPARYIFWTDGDRPRIKHSKQSRVEKFGLDTVSGDDVWHIEEYHGRIEEPEPETVDPETQSPVNIIDTLRCDWESLDDDEKYAIASAIEVLSDLQRDWESLSEDERYAMVSKAKTELLDQQ